MSDAYPSMLSALIKDLQTILDEQGDMPVACHSPRGLMCAKIEVNTEPYYWDGGILLPTIDTSYHCKAWVRSRTSKAYPVYAFIDTDAPAPPTRATPPREGDTIDGVLVEARMEQDAKV